MLTIVYTIYHALSRSFSGVSEYENNKFEFATNKCAFLLREKITLSTTFMVIKMLYGFRMFKFWLHGLGKTLQDYGSTAIRPVCVFFLSCQNQP